MPNFTYEALNETGKQQKGTITAANPDEAIARIRSKGLFPTSVREQKTKKKKGGGTKQPAAAGTQKKKTFVIAIGGIKRKDLTAFTRQLSTLQDAGLPILRSLTILEQQQKPGLLKNVLMDVQEDVSSGSTLSDAMAKHPKVFDRLFCKMIAAGEVGGVLDLILARLAEFMEKAEQLKGKIKSAMTYPVAVITVASLIVVGIMYFIVPSFEKIFSDFDTGLPLPTLFLISASKWLGGRLYENQALPGIVWVLGSPIFIILGTKLIRKSQYGKAATDWLLLKGPVIGQLVRKTSIARFSRTLGTLIGAGVPILDALLITRDTAGNYVFSKALDKVHDNVRQGESFSPPLREAKVCDAIVTNMIDVGEETGDLDKMLIRVANNYDEEVDNGVESLVSLLEPIMVVVLGVIVGGIVIALFLPLVKMMQSVMNQGG